MKLKDFLETDDFYTLTNNVKLLYLYLNAYKDKDNLVYCSKLIANMTNTTYKEFNELKDNNLIRFDEYSVPVEIMKECN